MKWMSSCLVNKDYINVDMMKCSISFLEHNAYVEYEYIKLDLNLLEVVKVTIN